MFAGMTARTPVRRSGDNAMSKSVKRAPWLGDHNTARPVNLAEMPRPYVTLAEHPTNMVRLACTKCERRGQYRKATLLERYGPDQNTVDLRLILAAGARRLPRTRSWICAASTIPTGSADDRAGLQVVRRRALGMRGTLGPADGARWLLGRR
jgi:hypothetical protein